MKMKIGINECLPHVTVRLGLRCNANCLFCNVPPESKEVDERDSREAKKYILEFIRNGHVYLDITGGEPTLRKDLDLLIEYALKNGARDARIQTNAILLADLKYAKRLRQSGLKSAFVGFHSHIPGIHNLLLGRNDAYEKCVKGIYNLLECGIGVELNPVLTTKNYMFLPEYMEFIKNNFSGISQISMSVVQPHGRAWEDKSLLPRFKEIAPFVKEALNKYMGIFEIFNPYCGLPLCIGEWWKYLDHCSEFLMHSLFLKKRINPSKDNNKVKLFVCDNCDLNKYCNGMWKEYLSIHPHLDIKPLKFKGMDRK